jgi:hypothetical protein
MQGRNTGLTLTVKRVELGNPERRKFTVVYESEKGEVNPMNFSESKGKIPHIDPSVQYVGVSKLRLLNAERLRSLDNTLVIQDDDKPLAVVLSYDQFLEMQKERSAILATLETIWNEEDRSALIAAMRGAAKGHTKQDSQVRRRSKKGGNKRSEER